MSQKDKARIACRGGFEPRLVGSPSWYQRIIWYLFMRAFGGTLSRFAVEEFRAGFFTGYDVRTKCLQHLPVRMLPWAVKPPERQ